MKNLKELFMDAQRNINQGRSDVALIELNKYSYVASKALQFDKSKFYLLKAQCLLKLNRFTECFDAIDAGLKENPSYPTLLFEKARCYFSIRHYAAAKRIYNDLIKKSPHKLKNRLGYISCFVKEKQYEQAIGYFKELLDDPRYAFNTQEEKQQLYHGLANCYRDMGDHVGAIEFYNKLINLNPSKKEYLQSKATCLYYQGNALEALDLYQQIIKQHPYFFVAHLSLAQTLGKVDPIKSIQKFEELIERFPNNPDTYIVFTRFLQNKDLNTQADKIYKSGLQIHPNNEKLQVGYAFFLLATNEILEADKQFATLMKSTATQRDVYLGYMLTRGKLGDWQSVIQIAEPKQRELQNYKEIQLCLSIAYYSNNSKKDLDTAEIYAQQALKLDPQYHCAWSQLGHIYGFKNDEKKAAEYFNQAYQCNPKRLEAHRSPMQDISPLVQIEGSDKDQNNLLETERQSILREMIATFSRTYALSPALKNVDLNTANTTISSQSLSTFKAEPTAQNVNNNNEISHPPEIEEQYEDMQLNITAKISLCQLEHDFRPYINNKINPLLKKAQEYFEGCAYDAAFKKLDLAFSALHSKLEESKPSATKPVLAQEPVEIKKRSTSKKTIKKSNKNKKIPPKVQKMDENKKSLQTPIEKQPIDFWDTVGSWCPCFFAKKSEAQDLLDKDSDNSHSTKLDKSK